MREDELTGTIFDIKEFALYDGPGLRCTVFMKGCPLRCSWCHNPEGQNAEPEIMTSSSGSRTVGTRYAVSDLVKKLLSYERVFGSGGGVTFSGGEPLMQAGFLIETMRRLKGRLSVLLQTSGYADKKDFTDAIAWADMVYFDLKLVNSELHKRYTGADNSIILDNLEQLDRSARVYRIRIPMIPGVTDTERNYSDIRDFIKNHLGAGNNLEGIDLLPYNQSAGGKYRALGRQFEPFFDEKAALRIEPDFFRQVTREAKIL